MEFRSRDDDGGSASDHAVVIVVGNATEMRGSGYWMVEYRAGRPNRFSAQTLGCYLDIAVAFSTVFENPLNRDDATAILFVDRNGGSAEELFDEQLLAAWLNFANGAVGLADPVDTDGDGASDRTFGEALLAAENVRKDPLAARDQLLAHKEILERILLRDDRR
ncbi:MAG: hypothetical protein EHM13_01490 [Acidobacteria bacterium]|nr:MAG: hypothetical protein EHM13_01490 [Acidobacteriota bacterium]